MPKAKYENLRHLKMANNMGQDDLVEWQRIAAWEASG
jgi:hypothetical protein